MCWHPHHKQWNGILYVQKPGKNIKKQHRLKNIPGFSPTWFQHKEIGQRRTWQLKKKKKKYFFLLDCKFIKYTLHRFLLPLACKTGRPVPALGGWGFVSCEGLRAHRSTGHDCARACRWQQYMNKSTSQTWDYLTKTPATWKSLKSLNA